MTAAAAVIITAAIAAAASVTHAEGDGVAASTPSTASSQATDVLAEHRTGHTFRLSRDARHLMGCNVRCMLGWCRLAIARAYAFGVYVDEAAILTARRLAETALQASPTPRDDLFIRLLDAKSEQPDSFNLSIAMVMAREIAGEHLAHGFKNSVLARLPSAAASGRGALRQEAYRTGAASVSSTAVSQPAAVGTAMPAAAASISEDDSDLAQLSRFASGLNGRTFHTGDELEVAWTPAGLRVHINGEHVPRLDVTSHTLARALFDVYVGANSVSARLNSTVNRNLADAASFAVVRTKTNDATSSMVDIRALHDIVKAEHSSRTK